MFKFPAKRFLNTGFETSPADIENSYLQLGFIHIVISQLSCRQFICIIKILVYISKIAEINRHMRMQWVAILQTIRIIELSGNIILGSSVYIRISIKLQKNPGELLKSSLPSLFELLWQKILAFWKTLDSVFVICRQSNVESSIYRNRSCFWNDGFIILFSFFKKKKHTRFKLQSPSRF